MTNRLTQLIWLIIALVCGTVLAEEPIRWAPDLATARRAAAEYKVPLLIHFYGDNCLPCKTLEHRVLSQQEIIGSLNRFFICVRINATADSASRKIAEEFAVHSWPTDVFVSPDGKTLFQGVCPQDPRAYAGILENVKVMNRDRNVMLAANTPQQPINGVTQQMNNVGSQAYAGNLPAPGANHVSESMTPTFYGASSNTVAGQQLPASTGPNPTMTQHGPLMPNAQTSAIAGSTPAVDQQLASAARPWMSNQNVNTSQPYASGQPQATASPNVSGQLPPRQTPVGQLANPTAPPPASFAMTQSASGSQPPSASTLARPPAQLSSGSGQVVQNPYFGGPLPTGDPSMAVATSVPAGQPVATQQIPAQQVAFQPRVSEASDSSGNTGSTAKTNPAPTTIAQPADDRPAIDGYCPVALRKDRSWVAGDPKFAVRHRGRVYWMSSQETLSEFLRDPDACSPKFSAYDPMLFLKEGKLVEGSVEFGLLEEVSGTFMFFSSGEMKREYEEQFEKHTRAINIIIEQAYGTK